MEFQTALTQTLILLIPILIGVAVRKIRLVDDHFAGGLSRILFNVSLPCTILNVMQMEAGPEAFASGGRLILICLAATLGSYLLSLLYTRLCRDDQKRISIYRFCITFSNFSYMAYPVAQALYGEEGLFYTAIYSLPLFVLVNSVGIMMLHQSGGRFRWSQLKKALNLPTFAVVVGVVLLVFQIKTTGPVGRVISMFDATTTPLAMLLAGLVLSRANWRAVFTNVRYYLISAMRLIVVPALIYVVLKLLGFAGYELLIPVLVGAMPVVANIVILTSSGGEADSETAANVLLVSTLLSVLTIPCITAWLR